jgi:hypothetical protein
MGTDRDARGRFLPGSPGGPGRPRRAVETDYLAALSEAVPLERWREIVETAVDQAVAGDAKARDWLGSYLAGKPTGHPLRCIAIAEAVLQAKAVEDEPATRTPTKNRPVRTARGTPSREKPWTWKPSSPRPSARPWPPCAAASPRWTPHDWPV